MAPPEPTPPVPVLPPDDAPPLALMPPLPVWPPDDAPPLADPPVPEPPLPDEPPLPVKVTGDGGRQAATVTPITPASTIIVRERSAETATAGRRRERIIAGRTSIREKGGNRANGQLQEPKFSAFRGIAVVRAQKCCPIAHEKSTRSSGGGLLFFAERGTAVGYESPSEFRTRIFPNPRSCV